MADPKPDEKTAEVVKEIKAAPKSVKKEMKLDHALVMSEVQLLLADKRTAFALLRTGVTVSLVPLSMWTVLVATSKLYEPEHVLWVLAPIMAVALCLFLLGIYLIWHALAQVRHIERTMMALRSSDTLLEDLLYAHPEWRWKPWRRRRHHA